MKPAAPRPALMHYIEERADLEASAGDPLDVVKSGACA